MKNALLILFIFIIQSCSSGKLKGPSSIIEKKEALKKTSQMFCKLSEGLGRIKFKKNLINFEFESLFSLEKKLYDNVFEVAGTEELDLTIPLVENKQITGSFYFQGLKKLNREKYQKNLFKSGFQDLKKILNVFYEFKKSGNCNTKSCHETFDQLEVEYSENKIILYFKNRFQWAFSKPVKKIHEYFSENSVSLWDKNTSAQFKKNNSIKLTFYITSCN